MTSSHLLMMFSGSCSLTLPSPYHPLLCSSCWRHIALQKILGWSAFPLFVIFIFVLLCFINHSLDLFCWKIAIIVILLFCLQPIHSRLHFMHHLHQCMSKVTSIWGTLWGILPNENFLRDNFWPCCTSFKHFAWLLINRSSKDMSFICENVCVTCTFYHQPYYAYATGNFNSKRQW